MQNQNTFKGLSKNEVKNRKKQGKYNKQPKTTTRSNIQIILNHFTDITNLIIFGSALLLLIYEQYQDSLLISSIMLINIFVSILQELKAKSSLKKLNIINKEPVIVIREGKEKKISPEDIVQDDLIKINADKYLFVDGELKTSENLLIDESILTGESDYKKKTINDKLFSGSFIVSGHGIYKATKVGNQSFVNKISNQAKTYIEYLSPLQKKIGRLVKILTVITIAVILILLSINFVTDEMTRIEILKSIISIVSSMVPQGIIITLTLAFMIGVIRMSQKGIIVQKAASIETLASTKVLCMDKTGTITQNKLLVKDFEKFNNKIPLNKLNFKKLIYFFTNNSTEKNKTILAIEKWAKSEINLNKQNKQKLKNPKILSIIPFLSKIKYSGMEIEINNQKYLLILGAFDSIKKYIKKNFHKNLKTKEKKFAQTGLRNLVFAILPISNSNNPKKIINQNNNDKNIHKNNDLNNMQFFMSIEDFFQKNNINKNQINQFSPLTLIGLEDKLRKGANKIISLFIKQGIKPVIISGDGPQTLQAILKQLKLTQLDKIIIGSELEKQSNPNELKEKILGHDVFARVNPEQKVQIIKYYQEAYKNVAMIGDGINDALAIKQANLGIALSSGANATKNIADVILLNDDLEKLSSVMQQGKEILYNTLRSAKLLFMKNTYSIIIIMSTLIFGLTFPFNPRALILLSFLNATIPILIMLLEKNIQIKKIQFLKELKNFVLIGGSILAFLIISLLVIFDHNLLTNIYFLFGTKFSKPEIQTITTSILAFCGTINALILINKKFDIKTMFLGSFRSLVGPINIFLLILCINIPFIRHFFDLTALNSQAWNIIIISSIIYLISFKFIGSKFKTI